MRTALVAVCRLLLRLFFRRIEVVGGDRVPTSGPVIYVLNHPNGLVDPLFILCLSDRQVSFLAKEPLFRAPVVGMFVRNLQCLPVYRKRDGADPAHNKIMLERSVALLEAGNAIAVFPEGTSHSDPALKPLKTGAARIALGARARGREPVRIVPAGLHYTGKDTFRSAAVLAYGQSIDVPTVELDCGLAPPADAVRELTERLAEALRRLTVQSDQLRVSKLAASAQRILDAVARDEDDPPAGGLFEKMSLQQRLTAGYAALSADPRVDRLAHRIERYEAQLAALGLAPDQPLDFEARSIVGYVASTAILLVVGMPLALVGWVLNYLTYRVVGVLAFRYAESDDVLATMKLLGGFALFPLTWLAWAVVAGIFLGPGLGFAVLAAGPASAYVALRVGERIEEAGMHANAVWIGISRSSLKRWIVRERRQIRDEVFELARHLQDRESS